ncbi:hypothetical protein [Paraburkholderia fungorum]|uniref:Lipoprotein n=1 Tax=Paraburkholderia fungorum TaxID=134537 RepID=A0A3R7GMW0_9BURK|nr:hypothetical protein [Paraburkholderia fungorum]RKF32947.1 hypothetical protein BCY88_38700 [Paraburkholderia fungorum]
MPRFRYFNLAGGFMIRMRYVVTLLSGALLVGCANNKPVLTGMTVADHGFVMDGDSKRVSQGDLHTTFVAWNADSNVAIFDAHGQGCFEAAAAIRSRNQETEVSATLTKLLGAGGQIEAINRVVENLQLLANKDAAATFLDISMANICLIAMNQTNNAVDGTAMKKADLIDLMKYAMDKAADIAIKAAEAPKPSPEIKPASGPADGVVTQPVGNQHTVRSGQSAPAAVAPAAASAVKPAHADVGQKSS